MIVQNFTWLLVWVLTFQSPSQPDTPLSSLYSNQDIESLTHLVNFFDQYVKNQTGENSLQVAYEQFNQEAIQQEYFHLNVEKDSIRQILASIPLSLWHTIWRFDALINNDRDKKTLQPVMDINTNYNNPKYIEFLSKVAQNDERIAKYYEMIREGGGLSPFTFQLYQDYTPDFSQIENRLIATIHYITHSEMLRIDQAN